MAREFDPGYAREPFRTLCEEYPDESVYPQADFRTEWGPIFHRGRLDGTARVLAIGQDPAAHESIARRILVGVAGQRVQGFLRKLGLTRRYVILNTFLYSVYGQGGGERHRNDPAIAAYRNRWFDAVMAPGRIKAVVAFGGLADSAWQAWKATPTGAAAVVTYVHTKHPTWPDSSSGGDPGRLAAATKQMLAQWNTAIETLRPAIRPKDVSDPLVPYGETWVPGDTPPIPAYDLPAGLPAWMSGGQDWAVRQGDTPKKKRANVMVTVPSAFLP
jgi:uracil-DNA glycosylase